MLWFVKDLFNTAFFNNFTSVHHSDIICHFGDDAKIMVTKASGSVGGTLEKIEAACEMGLKIIVIDRPLIEYGAVFPNKSGQNLFDRLNIQRI